MPSLATYCHCMEYYSQSMVGAGIPLGLFPLYSLFIHSALFCSVFHLLCSLRNVGSRHRFICVITDNRLVIMCLSRLQELFNVINELRRTHLGTPLLGTKTPDINFTFEMFSFKNLI